MRDVSSTYNNIRFWGPSTVVTTLSAAGVALLFAGVVSAPAHSRPAPDPDRAPATGRTIVEQPTRNCFIGQLRWPADMGRQPQCTVAQRTASHPRG